MLKTDAELYLPISEEILRQVLDNESEPLKNVLAKLEVPQLASLCVLQELRRLAEMQAPSPEIMLAKAIEVGNAHSQRGGRPADVLPELSRPKIREGSEFLADFGIALLDQVSLRYRTYLTADGTWDYAFRHRHTARLTERQVHLKIPTGEFRCLTLEQSRIFAEFKAQTDDHMHVQGYAGTGKSSLIKALLTILEPTGAEVLILAQTQRQVAALGSLERLERVKLRTFGSLMYEMIPPDRTRAGRPNQRMRRRSRRATMPDRDIVRHLGIHACGSMSAEDVAKAARSTVAGYCFSGDVEIEATHIPNEYWFTLDAVSRQVVLHHATELWKEIVSPTSRDFVPPVRVYHRIKWAALNRFRIPGRYSHVLIDECHDLAKSMLQILDYSSQAVISLGDEYQNLQGRAQSRSDLVRQRGVTTSVRSGCAIESIVNGIIAVHPGKTKEQFHGNPFNKLEIEYYGKPQVPERPATIVTNSRWGLFEWAQRVTNKDVRTASLCDLTDLTIFVNDCIALYREGSQPRHGELFRFRTWADVTEAKQANRSFQYIDSWLRKGYTYTDWQAALNKLTTNTPGAHSIGLIEDVRNREFDTVMLAPEIVDPAWSTAAEAFGRVGSVIYVAVTRATRRLMVPEGLRNWIEEVSGA